MTISSRLVTIVVLSALVSFVIAGIGLNGIRTLSRDEAEISRTATLLSNHQNADMMHDALRGVVFAAMLVANKIPGTPTAKDLRADLDSHVSTIREMIAANKQIANDAETVLTDAVIPALETYVENATSLITLALDHPEQFDEAKLARFLDAFSALEEKLGTLGERVLAAALEIKKTGADTAVFTQQLMLVLAASGIILSVSVSWLLGRSIRRQLVEVISSLTDRGPVTQQMNQTLDSLAQSMASATAEQAAAVQESVASMAEMSGMIGQTVSASRTTGNAAHRGGFQNYV